MRMMKMWLRAGRALVGELSVWPPGGEAVTGAEAAADDRVDDDAEVGADDAVAAGEAA